MQRTTAAECIDLRSGAESAAPKAHVLPQIGRAVAACVSQHLLDDCGQFVNIWSPWPIPIVVVFSLFSISCWKCYVDPYNP